MVGIQSQATFDQWYRDTAGVNRPYLLGLKLETSNGVSTFSASNNNGGGLRDSSFFPLDGQGFGDEGQNHNFSFYDRNPHVIHLQRWRDIYVQG